MGDIQIYFQEVGWKGVGEVDLAQDAAGSGLM
jgi:hypothetical protein